MFACRLAYRIVGWFLVSSLVVLWVLPGSLAAQQRSAQQREGDEFRRRLESRVGLTWSSNPLRQALNSLSRAQQVPIWLDRRVDPGQKMDFTAEDVSLELALQQLAQRTGLGVCYVGPVVYLGPPPLTVKLATLAAVKRQEAEALPANLRGRLLGTRPWRWDDLATPRQLIEQLAAEAELDVVGLDRIPHDLWAAMELPALPWTDRLTLVLAGFDLTFQCLPEQTSVAITSLPETVTLERVHRVRGSPAKAMAQLRGIFPEARMRTGANSIVVVGSLEEHERIERLLRGETVRQTRVGEGEKRYTLKVENQPLGGIVQALAARLELQVEFDPAVAPSLESRISFQVREATFDQLLSAILEPARLAYRLDGQILHIVPAGQGSRGTAEMGD